MRRFYVLPKTVFYEYQPGREQDGLRYHHLMGESHYVDLGDSGYILLACDDFKHPDLEDAWHAHPEIARLHHPADAGNQSLGSLQNPSMAHKQFKQHHMDALKHIGVTQNHTVWDIHEIVRKIHPQVRLDHKY